MKKGRSVSNISNLIFPAILFLISLFLAFLNYQKGTFLTGWDNLHPEFNLTLNLKRAIFSSWQEYQSLGLPAGMAHAADLPRLLFFLPFSFYLPADFLRYFWAFLMLTIGPLGAYFLAQQSLLKPIGPYTRRLTAFFAGLFYLLNLSTVQAFFTAFEPFISFYGYFPWLLLSATVYLNMPNKKTFLFALLTLFFAAPSFYVQTMFIVFIFCLAPFLLHHLITTKRRRYLTIYLLTLLFTQAYWLLPALYFTTTASQVTIDALQNQISTREVAARNQEFGNFKDLLLLKGFWFDYVDLGDNDKFNFLMLPWKDHLSLPLIPILGYISFTVSFLGLIFSYFRRLPYRFVFTLNLLLSLVFLANQNPPTAPVFNFLNRFPLMGQLFRSVYTKWSIAASLFLSVFFATASLTLYNILLKVHRYFAGFVICFSFSLILVLFTLPAFQGHLFYRPLRTAYPPEYFELFSYLNTQPSSTRIANFPQHTPWGWEFYRFGYRGSGFLWHGIPQPLLDRAFDVWSPYSEQYFLQMQQAIYSEDPASFNNLLEKYTISWLLLDENIINPATKNQTSLYLPQIKSLIAKSPNISLKKDFGSLKLYQVELASKPNQFLHTLPAEFTSKSPILPATNRPITDTAITNHSSLTEAKNCDNFNSTYFNRQVLANGIAYTATNANSCDHFLYPDLPQNQAYEITITHENLQGFPFLVCLESYLTNHCLVYQYLPEGKDLQTTTLKVPPYHPTGFGYTLHLFNYSIGRSLTANILQKIEIRPAPYEPENLASIIPATLTDIHHPNYALYTFSADTNASNHLILAQAYHPDWRLVKLGALSPSTPALKLFPLLPFLRQLPKAHQTIYDHANLWQLPESGNYALVFLPQYLQFLGFAFLLLLPLLFFTHKRKP